MAPQPTHELEKSYARSLFSDTEHGGNELGVENGGAREQLAQASGASINAQVCGADPSPVLEDGDVIKDLGSSSCGRRDGMSEPGHPRLDEILAEQSESGLIAADVMRHLHRHRRWNGDVQAAGEDPPDENAIAAAACSVRRPLGE